MASPFTSRVPDIRCVPSVIQQGRAALVTSFGIFKFTVCYSLTEFISTIILYSISSNLSGLQFLYIDILLFVNFAFFFGKTEAYDVKLAREPPTSSLVSFTPLFSLAVHTILIAIFELIVFHMVRGFDWYSPFVPRDEYHYECYENYSVFALSIFQYAIIAVIFSMGKPYRKSMFTNKWFCSSIFLFTLLNTYVTLYPSTWIVDWLELQIPPVYNWRFAIVGLAALNFVICLAFESLVVEYAIQKKIKPRLHRAETSKKLYVRLDNELKKDTSWPPISTELPHLRMTPSYDNIIDSTRKASIAESIISVCIVNESKSQRVHAFLSNGLDNPTFEHEGDINNVD